MKCQYCNAEIKDGLKFCTQCGKELVKVDVENEYDIRSNKLTKIVSGLMIIGLVVVLYMVICGSKNGSSFKFNSDHIKFLKTMGIDSIGTIYDDADGSKNFVYNDNQIYVYLDKNNDIKAVKFGDNKEVLWDDVYGKKKSLPKKKGTQKKEVVQQKETLKDVKQWYIRQIPRINDGVITALKNNGCSDAEVLSNKFYFGGDDGWYDCHYTVWYRTIIQGVQFKYEMRIFLKYKENLKNMKIWSISGFEESTGIRIAREYDERYEKIIEDYYKYLVKNYS